MTTDLLVSLVRLGFHGAALAMLFLGYMLMRRVLNAEATEQLGPRLAQVRFFLVVSLMFFLVGAGLELVRRAQMNDVSISISPMPWPGGIPSPTLLEDSGKALVFSENLVATVPLRHGAMVQLHLETIADLITRLESQLDATRQAEFLARRVALSENSPGRPPADRPGGGPAGQ